MIHTPKRFLAFSSTGDYLGFARNTQMCCMQFLQALSIIMLSAKLKEVRIFETDVLEGRAFDHRDLRYAATFTSGDLSAKLRWSGQAEEQPGT